MICYVKLNGFLIVGNFHGVTYHVHVVIHSLWRGIFHFFWRLFDNSSSTFHNTLKHYILNIYLSFHDVHIGISNKSNYRCWGTIGTIIIVWTFIVKNKFFLILTQSLGYFRFEPHAIHVTNDKENINENKSLATKSFFV